jgi:hypothetical protein
MCDECLNCHDKISSSKHHKTVPVEARQKAVTENTYCGKHPDKLVEVYCSDCSEAGCVLCGFLLHKTHDCAEIKEIAEQRHAELRTEWRALAEKIQLSREILSVVEIEKNDCIESIVEAEREVRKAADGLMTRRRDNGHLERPREPEDSPLPTCVNAKRSPSGSLKEVLKVEQSGDEEVLADCRKRYTDKVCK